MDLTAAPWSLQSLLDPVCVLLTALSQRPAFPQLTSKAIYNDYVQPIPLPKTSSDLPTGTKCVIAGWGLIDEDMATNKLFETKVSIYSRRKCILFYPHLDSGMICAGSFHELKDSSQVWGGHTGLSGSRSCCWHGHSQLPGQVTRSQFPKDWLSHHPQCLHSTRVEPQLGAAGWDMGQEWSQAGRDQGETC